MPAPSHQSAATAPGRLTAPGITADAESASRIRPCVPGDLPRVAELRRGTFRLSQHPQSGSLVEYLERVFFHSPWRDDAMPSLVYEDESGEVAGFIGVLPRRMLYRGEPIRVAVATQMMVAPESRGLAGRQLVRAVMSGPQDLTLSDTANESARRVWKSVGGEDALLYGFEWERVLRPLQHARWQLASRPLALRVAGFAAKPILAALDIAATRLASTAVQQPIGTLEPLDADRIAAVSETMVTESLRPLFDAKELKWLLTEAAAKTGFGSLAGGIVRTPDGTIAGWFAHYVAPHSTSHVLQLCARRGAQGLVMNHLLRDAWVRDAITVVGRLEASILPIVEGPLFRYRRQPPWTLVQSRRPELLHAIQTGDAHISRLDGEWWLNF